MAKNTDEKTGKILDYILGVSPHEFFLIPDKNGFIKIKELLKACQEDDDLKWINRAKINHYINISENPLIEISENLIKAKDQTRFLKKQTAENLPGELYICIRKKAWLHVYEKGLFFPDQDIMLFKDKKQAKLIGKRKDNNPVLLQISTKISLKTGTSFYKFGTFFTADQISKDAIKGPSVEKISEEIRKEKPAAPKKAVFSPGTFAVKAKDIFPEEKIQQESKSSWKKNKKKLRRDKKNFWPDQ